MSVNGKIVTFAPFLDYKIDDEKFLDCCNSMRLGIVRQA